MSSPLRDVAAMLAAGLLAAAIVVGLAELRDRGQDDPPECETIGASWVHAADPVLTTDPPTMPTTDAHLYWTLDCGGHALMVRAP